MKAQHGGVVTDWCRAVVEATDSLVTGSRALSAGAGSQPSIAASQTVAEYLRPSWLGEFRRRGEHLPVQLRVTNSQGVIAAVRSRDVEFGLIETPTMPGNLLSRRIGADRLLLVVSPVYPIASRGRPVSRAELAAMPLASREGGSGTRDTLRQALGVPMAGPAIELDSNTAVKVLISSGDYAAVISELAVANELRDGRLVQVPISEVDLRRSLHTAWREALACTRRPVCS